jgi:hypothetical protein
MRTTLDIDDDVLEAAKELAKHEKKTAGAVISDLARKALTRPIGEPGTPDSLGLVLKNGWYTLVRTGPPGVVTSEMVERLLERADLEDAGLIPEDE